mgnify:CR=1 FL=1
MNLKITANVKSAVRGLKKISKESKKTKKSMDKMAGGIAAVGAAIAGMGLVVAIKTIKTAGIELAVLGDRLAKQARMVGVTAKEYQGFEFAAKRSGTSITAVANGLKKLGRVMVDSRNGSRQMKETFAALDIELMKGDGTLRDVNDVFLDFAERSREMGESAERTGVTMLLLGRSGTELTNMMSQGAKGITDMQDVLEELNAVMSEDFLRSSEELVDVQADMEHAFRGVKIGIGTELIPALSEAGVQVTDMLGRMDAKVLGRFAEKFLDLAIGIALSVDHMKAWGLVQDKGFISKHEADLRAQSRALEDLSKNLVAGTLTWEDYVRVSRGLAPEIDVASEAFQKAEDAVVGLYGSSVQSAAALAPAVGALTTAQIGQFQAVMNATGEYQRAEETMVAYKTATEDQAKALTLLFKSNALLVVKEKELAAGRVKLVADQKAAGEQARKDAEARGAEIRRRVSAMGDLREAEADLAKARKEQGKEYLNQLKEESAAVKEYVEYISDLWGDYVDTFETLDRDLATDMFERREIVAEGFRARAMAADIQAAQTVADAKILLANEAFEKTHQDAARHSRNLATIEAERIRSIRLGSEETSKIILEQQLSDIAVVTEAIDKIGGMFSTLSGLAMQAYERGDAGAKKHAIALFHVAQALALSTAIVNTAAGVAGMLGPKGPPFPLNIAAAIGVGAAGAAEIATIVGTSIQGIGDAGITSDMLKSAGMNNHSAIVMRNDETLLDPVGTKHITEMLAMQKSQMQGGGGEQTIRTTVEIDGRVLGESVDNYMIRQQERGLAYGNRVRQEYV